MPWRGSKPCRTPADQHLPVPASSTSPPEPWNPAPTRRDSRAHNTPLNTPSSQNGPPEEPTDRHERSRLGQAIAEYGQIAKTLHLLTVVGPMDDTYHRQIHKQLTLQESRHKPARDIRHGKKSTTHQAYREGMENQLSSLGPVLNAAVLRTTRYIDATVTQLRSESHDTRDEDIAQLPPLKHRNLNCLARYSFTTSTPAASTLHPLRDPDTAELNKDDNDSQE